MQQDLRTVQEKLQASTEAQAQKEQLNMRLVNLWTTFTMSHSVTYAVNIELYS